MTSPVISLVVLTYNNLDLSKACVESLRTHTDLPHEVIVVDNGSTPEAAEWATAAGDTVVLNPENRGFSVGMNQGLAVATGELVAFVNNDTVFPRNWASPIAETMTAHPDAGIVAPAVTAAGNPATVRAEPGGDPIVFEPFGHLPSGVVYVMRTEVARRLGGWNEDYHVATGEDLDLLFTVWANGLEVILDPRMLVEHVSEASRWMVPTIGTTHRANLQQFLNRWKNGDPPPPRLDSCPPGVMAANLRHAAAAALWLERLVAARAEQPAARLGSGGAALASEHARLRELETQVVGLTSRLTAEQSKLAKVLGRRSVKLALGTAELARPIVQVMRRNPTTPERSTPERDQSQTTSELRRLRPVTGRGEGGLVSMVVLNRDGAGHLERLLPGLAQTTTYRSFELIVVDNASTDDSRSILARDWGYPITVIENDQNVTFSAGCNQGLAAATGAYVLLLNNDISPINPGWLGAMVDALEGEPRLGAVGALLVYPERPGYTSADPNTGADLTVQHCGIRFSRRKSSEPGGVVPWAYNMGVGADPTSPHLVETMDVPAATAACLLVRTEILRLLGGLDEAYIYGMEDVDLCLRIRDAGHGIAVAGGAALYHHEFGTQSQTAAARKRSSGLSNLQHFSETWAPRLSRLLDLEALEPSPHLLHHRMTPMVAIMMPRDDAAAGSGDRHTARELGDALAAAGHEVVYIETDGGDQDGAGDDVGLVICTSDDFDARRAPREAVTIAWIHDRTERWIEREWFGIHDVYIPGSQLTADLLMAAGVAVTEVIPLATNPDRFTPRSSNPVYNGDVAITADRESIRPGIEDLVVRPGERLGIYGKGWEGVPRLSRYVRGALPVDELAEVYASTRIVIDATASQESTYGAVDTRVFDALASGALVISSNGLGSEELFAGELPVYSEPSDLRLLLDRYLANETERTELVERLRATVIAHHTYNRRAVEIPAAARELLMRPRVAIKIGTPDKGSADTGDDARFATALSSALRRHGARPLIHDPDSWELPASHSVDAVIHIRGLGTYVPKPSHVNILWAVSFPEQLTAVECNGYDVVLVASETLADELRVMIDVPVEVMHRLVDPSSVDSGDDSFDERAVRLVGLVEDLLSRREPGRLNLRQ